MYLATMCSEKPNSLSVLDFLQALKQESQGAPSICKEGKQVSARTAMWT